MDMDMDTDTGIARVSTEARDKDTRRTHLPDRGVSLRVLPLPEGEEEADGIKIRAGRAV